MRVLVFTAGFVDPDGPGVIPGQRDLLRDLATRMDLDIHVLTPPPRDPGVHQVDGLSLTAHRPGGLGWMSALRGARPDVIWALWPHRSAAAAVAASTRYRRPVLVSVMAQEASAGLRRREALRTGAVLSRAAAVTVGSEWLRHRVQARFPSAQDKLRVLPLGVHVPTEPPPARRADGRPVRMVAVSTLQPVKQPNLLLGALFELRRQGLDARLDVYGYAQPGQADLWTGLARARGLADRVRFHGFVDPRTLRARLAEADVLVHASRHEAQGMALIEAVAVGLPVATSRVGVAEELVALGAAVEIAPSLTARALADRVRAALGRPTPAAAHRALAARFGREPCARRFEDLLRSLATVEARPA